jgi:hypothetical protein
MDRRQFLAAMALIGAQGLVLNELPAFSADKTGLGATARRKWRGKFDEDLVCIISDMHTNPGGYQPAKLVRTVDEILRLNPRPRNVIALGDLAYLTGRPEEYALLKEILRPFEGSGIHLTLGMGNHDRRENFAACFPEHKAASLLEDRYVYVVETPRADFIVLDSLQQGEDETTWITPGALDEGQLAWLKERLFSYTDKPVFVMAHHPIHETLVKNLLLDSPTCCGYIHGHDHVWRTGWQKKNYSEYKILPTLCVPSTGHWGDIGYTLLKMGHDRATASLREYEFFFPHPVNAGEPKPPQWAQIEQAHKDASWVFMYK